MHLTCPSISTVTGVADLQCDTGGTIDTGFHEALIDDQLSSRDAVVYTTLIIADALTV